MATVTHLDVVDVRFPTSAQLEGSEHFEHPAVVGDGRSVTPTAPGFSTRMLDGLIERYRFPDGEEWKGST